MISLVFSDVVIYNDRIDCKIRTEIVIHWAATETAEIEYYLFQGEAMKEITKSESKVMMVIWSSSQDLGLQEIMALLETNYDSLWTVSYTHLDVYKRQSHVRAGCDARGLNAHQPQIDGGAVKNARKLLADNSLCPAYLNAGGSRLPAGPAAKVLSLIHI